MNPEKINKLKNLAEILDAKKNGTESLVLLKKINDLKDELSKLQELLGVVENKATEKTDEVIKTLNDTYSTIESKIESLLKDHSKLNKDKAYSDNYFKGELQTIKNVVADLKNRKPEVIDRVIEKTVTIKEIPFVDAPQIALEASKQAVLATQKLIKPIPPFPTSTAIIEGINTEEGTLIKREKVEGLEELERKADFALSRPIMQGGGSSGIDIHEDGSTVKQGANRINFGAGLDVTRNGNGVTVTLDGAEPTNFTLQKVTDNGATTDNIITVPGVQFDTTATPATNAEGLLQWNATDGTLDLGMDNGDITMQIGQELFTKVRNPNGNPVINNGQVVYISGRTGAFPDASLARSDSESTSRVLGVATQTITAPDFGFITIMGYVRGIKTDYTGVGIWGTTWVTGDILYVSKTNAGVLTNVEPAVPHHSDVVGTVGIVHSNLGSILITLDRHRTLEELTDVDGTPLAATGQFPMWNQTAGYFDFDKNFLTDALQIDQNSPQTIANQPIVTAVDTDYVLINDTSDGGKLKKALKTDFGGGGAVELGTQTINRTSGLISSIVTPSKTWTVTRSSGIITSITDGTNTWTLNRSAGLLTTVVTT